MRLYHGSLVAVETPRILAIPAHRTADFGNGFYTTTDYEQARRWVAIRQSRGKQSGGFISHYEIPGDLLQTAELKVCIFEKANRVWLDFVMRNRQDMHFAHDYDLVSGPVANDRVYATLSLYEGAFLDEEEAIRQLKTYTLVNQILFHTQKALSFLQFTKSEKI